MSSDRGLPTATVEIVTSVAAHRTLTTAQLHTIHKPGRSRRWTQRVLQRIARAGLLAHVGMPDYPGWLWFVTETGAQLAQDAGLDDPPKLLTPTQAAGQLHRHTLAVSDAAVCWLAAARERGDEFGPLSWRHEVSLPLTQGRGRRRQRLVADAVLSYVLAADGGDLSLALRFVELDRATLSVDRLAAELARYADLFDAEGNGEPAWRRLGPVFPPVHCILTGAPRPVLERRRLATLALLQNDPRLARAADDVTVSVCLLEDLQRQGPFAPVFELAYGGDGPVSWLGGD
jgi:hypothetical protein